MQFRELTEADWLCTCWRQTDSNLLRLTGSLTDADSLAPR